MESELMVILQSMAIVKINNNEFIVMIERPWKQKIVPPNNPDFYSRQTIDLIY